MDLSKVIRVLVVDDSPIARGVLGEILDKQLDIKVVGYAADGLGAFKAIEAGGIDVVTLDVEMPKLDGLGLLEKVMRSHPLPVVMVAGSSTDQAARTMQALSIGAVDFIEKHRTGSLGFTEYAEAVVRAVRTAAVAKMRIQRQAAQVQPEGKSDKNDPSQSAIVTRSSNARGGLAPTVIAAGASTGGTEAVRQLLGQLDVTCPPIVIAVHMPAFFTSSFAARLNNMSALTVTEAKHGQVLIPGHAYIAPGGMHTRVISNRSIGARLSLQVTPTAAGDLYKPSVNHLFESVALAVGNNGFGFILTGMGDDGTIGARALRNTGAQVWGQTEETCVVFGMPRHANEAGVLNGLVPLSSLASVIPRAAAPAEATNRSAVLTK
jgi:two-component system, chemotaxis family, protein-glutamate methylesterase/glutaminase